MHTENIEKNKEAHREFQKALKSEDWIGALTVLAANGCTAKPSQAPALRDALRADPSPLTTGIMVRCGGARRLLGPEWLEPDRHDGVITDDWLATPPSVQDRYPHFSANEKADYRVRHYVLMGQLNDAIHVLRTGRLSCRKDDFDGELAAFIHRQVNRQCIEADGRSIAIRQEQ